MWGDGREAQEGGDICEPIADSHCCAAETSTTLNVCCDKPLEQDWLL